MEYIIVQFLLLIIQMLRLRMRRRRERTFFAIQRRRALFNDIRRVRYLRFIERNRLIFLTMMELAQAEMNRVAVPRAIWVRPRTEAVWTNMCMHLDNNAWKEHFRMTKETFMFICDELRPALMHQNSRWRDSISVEKRVAITLWRLATNVEFRTISRIFGVGRSTACVVTHEVTEAIVRNLMQAHLAFPSGDGLRDVVQGFELRWGFPQVAGAIDGTHIPIISPVDYPEDYYNRKGHHSIVLQAVVDYKYRFTDILVGWPGSVHDARVLANSEIYHKGQEGTLFNPAIPRIINGINIPLMIIGDPAYPLLPWLMKGFSDQGRLTPQQLDFNYRLSRARMVVEGAFGRLKGRWRCLLKRNDTHLEKLTNTIAACCILHNICENRNDAIDPEWDFPPRQDGGEEGNDNVRAGDGEAGAHRIREVLMEYFYEGH